METRTYKKGEIIFRQGDAAQSMFLIAWGAVGIYLDYGTAKEKKLTELGGEEYFGEMGMIDHETRSATAVALEKDTQLMEITEDCLGKLFEEHPAQVLMIMQQLTGSLRRLTREYMDVCRTAASVMQAEENGKTVAELIEEAEARTERRELFRARDYCDRF